MNWLYVFLGGGLGSVVRYAFTRAENKYFLHVFPAATLVSNVAACFILGIITGYFLNTAKENDTIRLLVATGFCGGFSTFSTFTSETFMLWRRGDVMLASANVLLSLILCFAALLAGVVLVRLVSKNF